MNIARQAAFCALTGGMALTVASLVRAQETQVVGETRTVVVAGTVVEFELVACPAGAIESGNAERFEVGALWVLKTEVTWDLYDVYLYALDEPEGEESDGTIDAVSRPSKPYVPPDRGYGHAGYPSIGMTRHAAESFCAWIEARTGLAARLPTGEEWSYLASSGTGSDFPSGADSEDLDEHAWHSGNTDNATEPAGQKLANGFGLLDMHGSAGEWVMSEGRRPIAMGGSFRDPPEACTSKARQVQNSSWNTSDPQIPKSRWWLADCGWVGFRFVVEINNEGTDDDD